MQISWPARFPFTLTKHSSVQSLIRLVRRGDMTDDSAEILIQPFLQEVIVSTSGMGREVRYWTLSIQHFLCRLRRRSLSKAPWTMVLESMPEPSEFPSLYSCQKMFLLDRKVGDLAPHSVVDLVLQVGDTEKLPLALRIKRLDPFFSPPSQRAWENEGDKRLAQCELACKADGVSPPDLLQSGNCCHGWGSPDADFCRAGVIFCTGLLPGTWNWSPLLTSGRSY